MRNKNPTKFIHSKLMQTERVEMSVFFSALRLISAAQGTFNNIWIKFYVEFNSNFQQPDLLNFELKS